MKTYIFVNSFLKDEIMPFSIAGYSAMSLPCSLGYVKALSR